MAVRSLGFNSLRRALRQTSSGSFTSSVETLFLPIEDDFSPSAEASSPTLLIDEFECSEPFLSAGLGTAMSLASISLKVPIRLNISSQSTKSPSNSGPSMQTNLVFPPIVNRQAPHIPVPSTMIVFSDTSFGMPYFFAKSEVNFIIIGGPIANTLSTCSR